MISIPPICILCMFVCMIKLYLAYYTFAEALSDAFVIIYAVNAMTLLVWQKEVYLSRTSGLTREQRGLR